jgi:hypothetical protein
VPIIEIEEEDSSPQSAHGGRIRCDRVWVRDTVSCNPFALFVSAMMAQLRRELTVLGAASLASLGCWQRLPTSNRSVPKHALVFLSSAYSWEHTKFTPRHLRFCAILSRTYILVRRFSWRALLVWDDVTMVLSSSVTCRLYHCLYDI